MESNNIIKSLLSERGVLLLDGAMGTMLMKRNEKTNEPAELLNIKNPDIIIDIHKEYIEAGCDIITANTFGANDNKLKESTYGYSIEDVVVAGIECAKKATKFGYENRPVKVALDIGAIGPIIGLMGDIDHEDAREMFARQVRAGAEAGADFVLIETMSDVEEVRDAIIAAKENSNLPIVCTMAFGKSGKTFMGVDPKSFTDMATEMKVDVIGANCSLEPKQMKSVIEELLANTDLPVMMQPNAGLPTLSEGQALYDMDEREFADDVSSMIDKGVSIVGGCCGTTPNFISVLRSSIDKRG